MSLMHIKLSADIGNDNPLVMTTEELEKELNCSFHDAFKHLLRQEFELIQDGYKTTMEGYSND